MLSTFTVMRGPAVLVGALLGLHLLGARPTLAQAPTAAGHCLLLPLEPARRVQQSALIVEAEVLDARSFWDARHRRLFTRHRLRVFSIIKGRAADTTGLELVTEGGQLGLVQQQLTNTLRVAPGQQGVFFLSAAPWASLPVADATPWAAYGSQQGFIEYSLSDGSAAEPFRTYPAVDAAFYRELAALTGQPRQVLQPNPALRAVQQALATPLARRGTTAPVISDLQPSQLAAGVGAVLTINGSDFGPSRSGGFVEFRNADDGGATWVRAREEDYLSWDNTHIQVRVPSSSASGRPAGSGRVRIGTSSQLLTESPGPLTITYALTNVEDDAETFVQRPNHVAEDAGGMSFRFSPNFNANAAASAAWQRALLTWRCQTGINWRIASPATTNAIDDDGENIIAFDSPGDPLPDRVLGRTTTYYKGCYAPDGQVIFWVESVDMQFDDAANFQFGPALAVGQIDFETVVVHELGHAQQLSHIIFNGAVMHYAVQLSRNSRVLDANRDISGGRKVLRERSFRNQGCGGPAMLPAPFTSFGAQLAGPAVDLRWTTRDECFLDGFRVERSLGTDTTAGSWETLVLVGAGQASSQYQFTDAQPLAGLHFYRLGVRRSDDTFDNTEAVAVNTEAATADFIIFPNPVLDGQLRLQFPAAASGNVAFRVFDELGRLHRRSVLLTQAGLNVLTLNVAGLGAGFYILRWQDTQGNTGSRKFVRL